MTNEKNWRVGNAATGNAATDGIDHRGWIVGHFMESDDIRMSKDVEIKWGSHPAGEERSDWQTDEYRTTVLLLISGRFRLKLSVDSYLLQNQGDYAIWGPGIDHSWKAEEDSLVITIRLPSLQ
jgi:quercetin dioxygenase-like cupin family protein